MKKKNIIMTAAALTGAAAAAVAGGVAYFFNYALVRTPDDKENKDDLDYGGYADVVKSGMKWFRDQNPEKISLMSEDGLRLSAYYLPAEGESRKAMVLMHGYRAKELADFSALYQFYHEQGYHLLVPRQRSHSGCDGQYITMGVKERFDCRLWAEYMNSRLGKDCDLYLSGISMGCATVLMATDPEVELPENVRGIIADCGYTSPRDIFAHVLKSDFGLPDRPLLDLTEVLARKKAGFGYQDVQIPEVMKKCRIPILFVHGEKDTFVPTRMSIDNYLNCRAPKELLIVPNAVHATASMENPDLYRSRAIAFMEKYAVCKG